MHPVNFWICLRSVGVANYDKSSDFSQVCLNSSIGNNEAQELSGGNAENTFFRIELDVICSEIVEREP